MQLNETKSQTIEHILFERMGVSLEDAFAIGADFVGDQQCCAKEGYVEPANIENRRCDSKANADSGRKYSSSGRWQTARRALRW